MIVIERLRALENKWRDELPYKGSAWEERHDIIEECADELATLIAELGQEVGAVAWIAPSSLESLNICRKDEHNGFVEVWMRPDEHRTIPLYTSPAHTSEARDAELIRALRNQYVSERTFRFQCENGMDYENARAHAESAVNQFEASFIAARERHAAMRQEAGKS